MPQDNTLHEHAIKVADLSFTMVVLCQEKELRMAAEFVISQSEFRQQIANEENDFNLTIIDQPQLIHIRIY